MLDKTLLDPYKNTGANMLMFFLGLTVGSILGITLVSILSAGALADEQIESIMKKFQNPIVK
jgi:hypothetical protein